MTTFTDGDLRACADAVLDAASSQEGVRIRRTDGREYVLRFIDPDRSPLDVGYVDIRPTREEVVSAVREGREREIGR
jgi:hypothetical protein